MEGNILTKLNKNCVQVYKGLCFHSVSGNYCKRYSSKLFSESKYDFLLKWWDSQKNINRFCYNTVNECHTGWLSFLLLVQLLRLMVIEVMLYSDDAWKNRNINSNLIRITPNKRHWCYFFSLFSSSYHHRYNSERLNSSKDILSARWNYGKKIGIYKHTENSPEEGLYSFFIHSLAIDTNDLTTVKIALSWNDKKR